MNYPFREHLEVEISADGKWLRCVNCSHRLCGFEQYWKVCAHHKFFAPTKAGPLTKVHEWRYLLEKL